MYFKQASLGLLSLSLLCGGIATGAEISADNLQSTDPEVVIAIKFEILTNHRTAVKAAVEVLEQARDGKQPKDKEGEFSSNDPRLVAIQILSELRAPESVTELLRIVHVKTERIFIFEGRPRTRGDYYPAAGALVKIGKPAVSYAVWELTKKGSALRRENLCWIIGEIEGSKAGRWRIEETIAELEKQIKEAKAKGFDPPAYQAQITKIEKLRAAIPILEELFATEQ